MKVNMHTPTNSLVKKVSNAVETLKKINTDNIGKSGLPVDVPVEKVKDDKILGLLLDEAYNYQIIKDKIQISANDLIRLHNIGKK